MPTVPHFPERLKYHRLRLRMSQADLGEKIGVSQNAIGTWERSESTPQIPELLKLCDLFRVSIAYMTGIADSICGLDPGAWIVDEEAVAFAKEHPKEARKKGTRVAARIPRRARIVSDQEAEALRRELGID